MPLSKCFPCLQFKNEEVVTKLDYSNSVLTEIFPVVWQHERTLEELHVTSTRINNLPPQLFYCQGLKVLQANNNNLETIPEAVGTLRQLQQLNLSRNYISNVPESIKSCKHLTHLDLSFNTLQRLPDAITSLISLQELLLNETYLEFLPANFGRLVNLRIVELRLNNLISLPKSMQRLTSLQRLDIGGNEFTKMPEVIGELKQLREFWFDFNQIREVPPALGKLRELQHFEANGNFINSLPNEISSWHNLEVISISTNELSSFPFSVGMLKSLVTFKCESNELKELPDSISNLQNLEELVISHNKIMRLPNTIGMLRKLRYLFADDNDLRQLPDEICSCASLSVLSVSRNKITELPSNIGHLSQLKVLNIVQNHIATLPVSVFSLVNLTSLWISNNQAQPLVPLQYVDAAKKTHLTCFMLPQLGSKQGAAAKLESEEIYNSSRRPQVPVNNCVSPTRRICFAEETTILNTNQTKPTTSQQDSSVGKEKPSQEVSPPPPASSFAIASNAYGGTSQLRENVNYVPAASKEFLMRSPTPYPKELRLMAKYIRRNQQNKPFEDSAYTKDLGVQEAKIIASPRYADSQQEFVEFVPSSQTAAYVTSYAIHSPTVDDGGEQLLLQQMPSSNINWQQQQEDKRHSVVIPNGHVYYENNHNLQTYTEPVYQPYPPSLTPQEYYHQHYEQEQQVVQSSHPVPDQIYYHSPQSSQPQVALVLSNGNGPLDPPPYHIARSYTKKTAEDLTNYEVIRQQQQQQQYDQHQQPQTMRGQPDTIYQMIQPPATEAMDYQNNMHLTGQPQTTATDTAGSIQNTHEAKATYCQENEQVVDEMIYLSLKENNNTANNSNTLTDMSPKQNHNSHNSTSKAAGLKNKTPWLFGVHRNPTVKQITLKWEHQRGFEIGSLPHKEGIFVTNTTPDTEASRLLCLYDKVLDVDSNDFTSITLDEARQLIANTGNSISIMLSRK